MSSLISAARRQGEFPYDVAALAARASPRWALQAARHMTWSAASADRAANEVSRPDRCSISPRITPRPLPSQQCQRCMKAKNPSNSSDNHYLHADMFIWLTQHQTHEPRGDGFTHRARTSRDPFPPQPDFMSELGSQGGSRSPSDSSAPRTPAERQLQWGLRASAQSRHGNRRVDIARLPLPRTGAALVPAMAGVSDVIKARGVNPPALVILFLTHFLAYECLQAD